MFKPENQWARKKWKCPGWRPFFAWQLANPTSRWEAPLFIFAPFQDQILEDKMLTVKLWRNRGGKFRAIISPSAWQHIFPRPSCPIDGGGRYCLRLLNPEKNDIWGLNKSRSHLLPNPRSLGVTSVAWNLDQPTLSLVFILMIMMVLIMKWKSWLWPTHRKLPPDASYSPSQSPSVALSSSSALVEASSQSPSSSLTHHIHL